MNDMKKTWKIINTVLSKSSKTSNSIDKIIFEGVDITSPKKNC